MIYKIYDGEGKLLSATDEPRFVKKGANGSLIKCPQSEATAIAIDGEARDIKTLTLTRQSFESYIMEREAKTDYMAMMTGVDIDAIIEDEEEARDDEEG